MSESSTKETALLRNLWDQREAAALASNSLELLRYRSNLLGEDLRITNFGGGTVNKPSSVRLEWIDVLRGIAILMVILLHVGTHSHVQEKSIKSFTDYGSRGVQLFFVVSAFTLFRNFTQKFNPKSFYIRRYARIAPMFPSLPPPQTDQDGENDRKMKLGELLASVEEEIKGVESDIEDAKRDLVTLETRFAQESAQP